MTSPYNVYTEHWLRLRHPDHNPEEWQREKLGLKPGEEAPAPPTEEERLAQIAERNAAIDAEVTAQVKAYFPYLLEDGEPKPVEPRSDLDREIAAIAENCLRSKS